MDKHDPKALNKRINRMMGAILALLVMLVIKSHFSSATAGQLTWMLAPTARLTAWLAPVHPVWESGAGYVDLGRGIIIAPGCAGINFLIMAFGLAAFIGLLRIDRLTPLLAWLALSLSVAYGLAVAVNAVRIAISIQLYQAGIQWGWLTVDRIHRLIGVGVYLGALGLFFKTLEPIIECCGNRPTPTALPDWLPLGWYLLGAVGVPTANLLFRNPAAGYGEHCVTVILAGAGLYAGSRLPRWFGGRFSKSGLPGPRMGQDHERFGLPYEQGTDCRG